jgi:hypothetical protein
MEQRSDGRVSVDLHAVVACPRIGLFRGSVKNLSKDGLYVRTPNVSMCLNVPVTITLQADANDPDSCCTAQGVVVHQSAKGFGVRFEDMDADCARLVREITSMDPLPRAPGVVAV